MHVLPERIKVETHDRQLVELFAHVKQLESQRSQKLPLEFK